MSLQQERERLLADIERMEQRLSRLRRQYAAQRSNDLRDRIRAMQDTIRGAYVTLTLMQRSDDPRPVYRRPGVEDE